MDQWAGKNVLLDTCRSTTILQPLLPRRSDVTIASKDGVRVSSAQRKAGACWFCATTTALLYSCLCSFCRPSSVPTQIAINMHTSGPSTIDMDRSKCYPNPHASFLFNIPSGSSVCDIGNGARLCVPRSYLRICRPGLASAGRSWPQSCSATASRNWLFEPLFGAETDLQHLLPLQQHCSECNAVLSRCDSLKTQAVILHTAGPISKHHIPVRCRNRTCQRCSVLMWHNYSVESGKHIFTGCPHELRCFMLTSSFGFSIAWLQQFHARLVRQHASFIGESDVVREHARACGQEHLLPTARLRLLISEGWFKWRLLLRTYGCRQPVAASPSIDLRKDIDELLEPFMPAFQADFTKEAMDKARAARMRCDVLVMDGNAKNRRAVCASLLAGAFRSPALGQTLRHTCPCTPRLGKSFCPHHDSEVANIIQDWVRRAVGLLHT